MKFFVSYRRRDDASRGLAIALLSQLSDRRHEVFVDEHKLPVGADWQNTIEVQIADCDAVILLVCRDIGQSEYVPHELRTAARYEKPVLPVLVQYPEPRDDEVGAEVAAVLRKRQYGRWTSLANTPWLVEELPRWVRVGAPPAPEPPRKPRWWWLPLAALLLAAAVLAANRMIRAHQAKALDLRAEPLLKSGDRADIDRGLALSALAASRRGGPPRESARAKYAEMHYERLLATLRSGSISGGNALAVSARGDAIVDGNRLWRCVPPEPVWQCREPRLTRLTGADVLAHAAFVSDDEIVTLDIHGRALRWSIDGAPNALTTGAAATAIDAANGEIAVAFAGEPFELVYDANGNAESPPIRPMSHVVSTLAFGPCAKCVTMRDRERAVYLWDRGRGTVQRVTDIAHAVAASPKGALAAVAEDRLLFFDGHLRPTTIWPQISLETVGQMEVSGDGKQAVLVHDGRVTLVDSGGNEIRIISGSAAPRAVAAQFHGDVLVTRSPTEVRVWLRGSVEGQQTAPDEVWPDWRERLGFVTNGRGELVERVFEAEE